VVMGTEVVGGFFQTVLQVVSMQMGGRKIAV